MVVQGQAEKECLIGMLRAAQLSVSIQAADGKQVLIFVMLPHVSHTV